MVDPSKSWWCYCTSNLWISVVVFFFFFSPPSTSLWSVYSVNIHPSNTINPLSHSFWVLYIYTCLLLCYKEAKTATRTMLDPRQSWWRYVHPSYGGKHRYKINRAVSSIPLDKAGLMGLAGEQVFCPSLSNCSAVLLVPPSWPLILYVKDAVCIYRKRVGLTAGSMKTQKHCIQKKTATG